MSTKTQAKIAFLCGMMAIVYGIYRWSEAGAFVVGGMFLCLAGLLAYAEAMKSKQ